MSTQELETFIRTHAGVKSIKEMAAECYTWKGRITKIAHKLGISLRSSEQIRKREELEKAIRENYKTLTCSQISELIKQPVSTVQTRARGMELKCFSVQKRKEKPLPIPRLINNAPTGYYLRERDMDMWWTAGYERTA